MECIVWELARFGIETGDKSTVKFLHLNFLENSAPLTSETKDLYTKEQYNKITLLLSLGVHFSSHLVDSLGLHFFSHLVDSHVLFFIVFFWSFQLFHYNNICRYHDSNRFTLSITIVPNTITRFYYNRTFKYERMTSLNIRINITVLVV